jgi:signal transduction histidine kinase
MYKKRSPRVRSKRASVTDSVAPVELSDVLITSKLVSRRRRPNPEAENLALYKLARVMAENPAQLVDSLLSASLELCDAGTAGLSVLDTDAQLFRWTNLVGSLNKHVGGTTPREFSPCGVTLERNSPQLFLYPGRRFQYFQNLKPSIAEALVLPVRLDNEVPATIWIVSHNPRVHFDTEDVRIMVGLANFTAHALRLLLSRDEESRGRLVATQAVAIHEKTEDGLHQMQSHLVAELLDRTEQLEHLSSRLMAHQDDERRRIARDLHDSAGQYLSAILMNLDSVLRDAQSTNSKIAEAREMANRCLSETRTISYLLHPPLLDVSGLGSALITYVEGFAKRSEIAIELEIPESLTRFSNDIEAAIFRVVQQSLSNIHRHSGSRTGLVAISVNADNVSVRVCDKGRGIPPKTLKGFNSGNVLLGVGLAGMRERIRSMGGRFVIDSDETGTTVDASIPLSHQIPTIVKKSVSPPNVSAVLAATRRRSRSVQN